MGLGVLEDTKLQHVPGTVTLEEQSLERSEHQALNSNLKYDLSVPQPSDDPNDPLNWPLWRRDMLLAVLSLIAVIASTLSPLLAANTLTLALHFRRTFTAMALLTGYHLLGVGIGGILFVPSARVWGKRHLYLLGTVIVIFSSAWAGASGASYKSLLWARIFQGVGLAPFEALVNASVGDLYCVHERGKRMAVTTLALFGGAFFTPVVVGKITHSIGWEWTFYLVTIFSGVLLPVVVLFVPETAFRRQAYLDTDTAATEDRHYNGAGLELSHDRNSPDTEAAVRTSHSNNSSITKHAAGDSDVRQLKERDGATPPPAKASFARSLLPFNGRKTDETYWKLLLRPFPLFLHPAIFWACLIQGTLIGWTVFIGIVLAAIMLGPPLFFDEVQTGYMYTGAFVGALVGFAAAGALADTVPRWITRRFNAGVYEPEFRLPALVAVQLVLGCAGLYGFGVCSANTVRYGWFWPDFFFGCVVAGMVVGAVAASLYIVDAHREIAVEAFTCMMIFKNIFSFGLTFSGYDWLVRHGIKPIFLAIASVQVVVCLSTILLYVLGKRNRSFFARHDILKMTNLR